MELEWTFSSVRFFFFYFQKFCIKVKNKKTLNKNEIPNEIEQTRCKINNKKKTIFYKVNEIDLLTYGGFVKEKKVEI